MPFCSIGHEQVSFVLSLKVHIYWKCLKFLKLFHSIQKIAIHHQAIFLVAVCWTFEGISTTTTSSNPSQGSQLVDLEITMWDFKIYFRVFNFFL